ncbi:hypothetical protein [Treponema sp.]|uniref:hypothetical protein n=1 Tax=Treponema sp. TaxID=166 RepID=UPI00298E38A5|nr:hypothetical protein [Treponema sp.]MCQ2240276.1 hypothetical protein [Treponema sp.]
MNVSFAPGMSGFYSSENSPVTIADGQKIRVTVLKNNGDGTSLVSFGGGKFNVKCQRNFEAGQTFEARVVDSGGKILLQPEGEKIFASSFVRFMEANGLVPDQITAKVFEFMEQSGVRIDKKILQKSRYIALNFPGKEKAAAEIACMLLEKGIEPTEENVGQLLAYIEGWGSYDGENGSAEKEESDSEDYDAEDFLSGIYSILPCRKCGILGFLNHYKTPETSRHWVVLPYEWRVNDRDAKGFIKFLLNADLKTTEKIQINCEISCKKYFFVLYYSNSKVKEVRFCSLPPLLSSQIENEEKRLGELFCSGMNGNSVPVTYSDLAYSEGLYSSSEIPFSFEDIA